MGFVKTVRRNGRVVLMSIEMNQEVEKRLKGFYGLKDGWYYDAGAVSPFAIRRSLEMLPLTCNARPYPNVYPIGCGVTLEWVSSDGRRFIQVDLFEEVIEVYVHECAEQIFMRIYVIGTLLCAVADLKKWIDWAYEDPSNMV
jgi:hypothetical protein